MKKLVALVLAAVLVLSLGLSVSVAEEKTKIVFANYALLENNYTEFWNGVKEGFEAAYPQYEIEWLTAPYADIMTTCVTTIGAGSPVDLLFGEIDWVSTAEDAGMTVPATKIFSEEDLKDFYPAVLEAFRVNGEICGLPMYITPYVLYYNTELFAKAGVEKAPETFEELMDFCAKFEGMTTEDGSKVYPFGQTTASVAISGSSLQALVYNYGGHVLTPEGALDIDNAGFKQAITLLKDLDDKGYLPQNAKLKDLRNLFALGQLAMYYDQSWGFSGVKGINPDATSFTASAAPLKGGEGNGLSVLQSHCLIYTTRDEAKYEGLRALTAYILSEPVLGPYLTNITPAYPATYSLEGMEAIQNSSLLAGAAGAVSNVTSIPPIPQLTNLNLELTALAQAVTVADQDVDSAIEAFRTAAENLLDE